jgi:DNA polymerase I
MRLLRADTIRRCLIADPGMSIISADFDQIEWRVIAGMAGEQSMIEAAKRGESIHKLAATKLFGPDYTPDQYKRTKNINFTWAFGGGPGRMARSYGIPLEEAKALTRDYEEAFPALVKFKRREQESILRSALSSEEYRVYKQLRSRMYNYREDTREGRAARAAIGIEIKRLCWRKVGYAVTPFGRRIVVDAEKSYTVINYKVQSSARDIMARQLLAVMDDPELEPTVLLLIHDEILGQAYRSKAEYIAQRYGEVMSTEFLGVPITASGKVYGKSWGHGYRKDA